MKLYGTTTSPFVRRVRVVAQEVGEPIDRIDTATDDGQAALRDVSPIRKVPVALIDGRTIYDSRAIIDWLTTTRGWGTITPPRDRWHELNLVNALDAAIESAMSLFHLRRDGVAIASPGSAGARSNADALRRSIDGTPFAVRQLERTEAILTWVAPQLSAQTFGLAELTCMCALEWMDFRQSYDTRRAAALEPVRAAWRERPSLATTRPHV